VDVPAIIAVIGASNDRRKFGNKAVRAFRERGYTVLPINPNETEVEGLPAFASLRDVPGPVDMVSFYVPPDVGLTVMPDVAAKGVRDVWLNPGSESAALIARARALGVEPIVACSLVGLGSHSSTD
jgi:uncharacterized protein